MWDQYRRTVIPIQLFIVGFCLWALFTHRAPFVTISITFVVMELAAIAGARWGLRLKRKAAASAALPRPLPVR